MDTVDILIIIGVLLFVALGIRDGFFKKLYGILGFFGGLIAATKLMSPVAQIMIDTMGVTEETAIILAFFSVFIVFIILVNLLYRWFGRSSSENLGFWSRIFGGALGTIQGICTVSLVLAMLSIFQIPEEESVKDSVLYEEMVQITPTIFDYSTKWMPDSKEFFEEIKDILDKFKSK